MWKFASPTWPIMDAKRFSCEQSCLVSVMRFASWERGTATSVDQISVPGGRVLSMVKRASLRAAQREVFSRGVLAKIWWGAMVVIIIDDWEKTSMRGGFFSFCTYKVSRVVWFHELRDSLDIALDGICGTRKFQKESGFLQPLCLPLVLITPLQGVCVVIWAYFSS